MLKHAKELPVHAQVAAQVEAIRAQRSLLSQPDPVPPLANRLADALREELGGARGQYVETQIEKLPALLDSDAWKRLDEPARRKIRDHAGLLPEPELRIATDSDLLRELDAIPLPLWKDRIGAVPQKVTSALLDAERLLTPEAVHVSLPTASLKSENDVDEYIQALREMLMKPIRAGTPVIV